MRRYTDLELIRDSDNVRHYETVYYPTFPVSDEDLFIIARAGDRLDLLAYEHYQDQTLWFIIAKANNLGNGSLVITPGLRIRIPSPGSVFDIRTRIKENQF